MQSFFYTSSRTTPRSLLRQASEGVGPLPPIRPNQRDAKICHALNARRVTPFPVGGPSRAKICFERSRWRPLAAFSSRLLCSLKIRIKYALPI